MIIRLITKALGFLLTISLANSCKFYNFTGGSVSKAKTFQVDYFVNNALIVEQNLDRDFTITLQDYIQRQTNLNLTREEGDLIYEGEITDYSISPMTATADQTAAQNQLSIAVRVKFTNTVEENKDFDKTFSFFYNYDATKQLQSIKSTAIEEIFDRITQDIFNASLANW